MHKIDQRRVVVPFSGLSSAQSHLWLPGAALSACIRGVVTRDTRGAGLDEARRYNHFPATPLCSITWYFSGCGELLTWGSPADAASPGMPFGGLTFSGPWRRPFVVRNPGPMHAMMLLFLPDALATLTGIDPGAFLDRTVPAETVLDGEWLTMCRDVARVADDDARASLLEDFLLPRWQRARPETAPLIRMYTDWSQNLALRAANSGFGRSLRQVERRIKQWSGRPLRELRGLGRAERAFFDSIVAARSGTEPNWSEVASNVGYADQSHLCRQTRRITGFPPEELRRRAYTDESFWVYRLWGFSDGQLQE